MNQGLFMDDDKRFVINIMPSVKIPQDQHKFQTYLDNVFDKFDNKGSKKPCVLQELIEGVKFVVNVICKNGRILTLQVSFLLRSSNNQFSLNVDIII